MVYCTRCGSENPDGTLYCKECGAFIGDDEEKRKMDGNVYSSIKEYPITLSYNYKEPSSRAELLIRIIYVIFLNIIIEVWGIVAGLAQIFQFFYVLIYAKKHKGAFDFITGFFRFYFNVTTYTYLLTDDRPPITSEDIDYPCKITFSFEQSSRRIELLIRIFYGFVLAIIASLWGMLAAMVLFIEWFYILFTTKKNFGLWEFSVRFINFYMRVNAYNSILTDERPPLTGD
ncbi:MAG: hypothetical protein APG12_00686 [Candidatus Methanofastidiosum methylothiophilum]|uniref:Zinc-ribbon domain-containing protein n=1 Tax=Candidatus Methanofastidiosum methylothiophilum TaxID=1705564 RepID=A0A150ITF7_9EURY|nr:MAG: hypothetical protein APG10_00634 [Candidatus Methanofastidiosum methylthiophilus]KYC47934.1 MAG: hypothetical protein APG11_00709 [Candidatus Methanofastidiosum methylthiophilus]KYC50552.1 MAG: hypothetical protein APG12_00686 [Candidatus Methanofastidiosum methylthiophilus]